MSFPYGDVSDADLAKLAAARVALADLRKKVRDLAGCDNSVFGDLIGEAADYLDDADHALDAAQREWNAPCDRALDMARYNASMEPAMPAAAY